MSLDLATVRDKLSYDPETGLLYWKRGQGRMKAGMRAGSAYQDGYVYLRFQNRRWLAHRICWALHYGDWPARDIDHIDGNKENNRPSNLRLATILQNNWNTRVSAKSRTGLKGVSWNGKRGLFEAKITANRKTIVIGAFDDPAIAAHEYNKAAIALYGEFACLNPI